MQCHCPCHNPLIKEKADHLESGCPKCVTGSVKECHETERIVKEQLLRLCRFDECLQAVLKVKDEEGDLVDKLSKIFGLAEEALIPTVLCVSCKSLTTKSPCEKCGVNLV